MMDEVRELRRDRGGRRWRLKSDGDGSRDYNGHTYKEKRIEFRRVDHLLGKGVGGYWERRALTLNRNQADSEEELPPRASMEARNSTGRGSIEAGRGSMEARKSTGRGSMETRKSIEERKSLKSQTLTSEEEPAEMGSPEATTEPVDSSEAVTLTKSKKEKKTSKTSEEILVVVSEKNWFDVMEEEVDSFFLKYSVNARFRDHKHSHRYLNNYIRHYSLGKGTFGRVMLCRSIDEDRFRVMKIVDKKKIVKKKLALKAVNEKRLLHALSNPFVVEVEDHFQNNSYLFMVMEFLPGGDLYDYLKDHGAMLEEHVQFYVQCMVLAVEYLQYCGIAYRDLKPENIMVANDGYPKLCDFALAKMVVDELTFSFTGCPIYMAPEILQREGYTKAVDFWTLGVLCYELACGQSPFFAPTRKQVFKLTLQMSPRYPSHLSRELIRFVEALLRPVDSRLGVVGDGIEAIKRHPFFNGASWLRLYTKARPPPFFPQWTDPLQVARKPIEEVAMRVSAHNLYEELFNDF